MGDGANPKNEEKQKNTEATSEREKAESLPISNAKEDMKRKGNVKNPSRPNPGPNGGTWQYQPNPTFRPHQGSVQFNPWHEIAYLRQQLEASQYHQNNLYLNMVAANKRASYHQFQVNKLHEQMHETKRNQEETIKDLIEQLEEASSNKPNDISETDTLTNDNEAIVILDEVMVALQDQISHPTTEQCVESATPTTEASHTDSVGLMSSKEAEFEVQCRIQQEQIEMLQKQLLAAQNQLEEQAVKHRQEQETLNLEISDLKSQLCSNKALHDLKVESLEQELKEAKASSLKIAQEPEEQNANEMPLKEKHAGGEKMEKEDSLPSTAMSLQEPLKEKDTRQQEKEEKEDSPALSVQESLQSLRDKQKMFNVKVAELETEVKSLPEVPPSKKKKKKRNCLRPQFHLIGLNIKS
ncbi:centrosome-associated protein CEP250-like [Pelmatolapia mariae]|uniref:centrosome-associated protein CEP250-like n=1 Tax=Pelmatolapia mariae TaxID=158779 RepID=UPI003211E83C